MQQHTSLFDERMARVLEASPYGVWIIQEPFVNIKDLINAYERPGAIVRVQAPVDECIKFVPGPEVAMLGCVAGWLCDDEVSDG